MEGALADRVDSKFMCKCEEQEIVIIHTIDFSTNFIRCMCAINMMYYVSANIS